MRLLVCGGAGFIGSNFIRFMLTHHNDVVVVNFDVLTYAANLDNLSDVATQFGPRYTFVRGDIVDGTAVADVLRNHQIDTVINFAAETHVDRSIHLGAQAFVRTNVLGVCVLLDAARAAGVTRMLHVSTDEVYGTLTLEDQQRFTEDTPFTPNVPYAAAKAGGDLLCRAYAHTHQFPVIVTHCSNNYGPYQFPEKLIPFVIFRALANESVPVYGDGNNVRDWIHVDDHCAALDLLFQYGVPGEVYNIGADNERNNIEVVGAILDILKQPRSLITFVTDRPGHDRRYAIDAAKLEALGWRSAYPRDRFAEGLEQTVRWYLDHRPWVERLRARASEINAHVRA